MKFGKHLASQQISGWAPYYIDYKGLKKIINSLEKGRLADAALLATGVRPDSDSVPSSSPAFSSALNSGTLAPTTDVAAQGVTGLLPSSSAALSPVDPASIGMPPAAAQILPEDSGSAELKQHRALFFWKLERELEKINTFYLQKEAELKERLKMLLHKRHAIESRVTVPPPSASLGSNPAPASLDSSNGVPMELNSLVPHPAPRIVRRISKDSPSFIALYEGFRYFEKDLSKLQQFIELNATGFRKILKKWDKRSKSQTKELYLARQVEVQPCFNREFIAEMSDVAAQNLLELENISESDGSRLPFSFSSRSGANGFAELGGANGFAARADAISAEKRLDFAAARELEVDTLSDLEKHLSTSLENGRIEQARTMIRAALSSEDEVAVSRIVWRALLEVPEDRAQHALEAEIPNYAFVDDINFRTCLHEAALAGSLILVKACVERGQVDVGQRDVYGRTPLSCAALCGHADICTYLLQQPSPAADPNTVDLDGFSPLVLAVMAGRVYVVEILLACNVAVDSREPSDLNPLCLSAKGGHVAITKLLLERGAKIIANAEGLTPQALAARDGHLDVLRLVCDAGADVNVKEKGTLWTPLFFAAEAGHAECVQLLLERGADVNAKDEKARTAAFYAAWNGRIDCLLMLLAATGQGPSTASSQSSIASGSLPAGLIREARRPSAVSLRKSERERERGQAAARERERSTRDTDRMTGIETDSSTEVSPAFRKRSRPTYVTAGGEVDDTDMSTVDGDGGAGGGAGLDDLGDLDDMGEIDMIPSLSLPPPIIPFRTYGHNYLDKRALVSVSLTNSSVKLYKHEDPNRPEQFSTSSLKLVMTSRPDESALSIPSNIVLPLADEREVFSFQVDSLDRFSIEWELMPTFGSKVIGKAVALPSSFEGMKDRKRFVLPLQDVYLKVVGEVSFELDFVKPFDSVQLEIGGRVETYWKSMLPSPATTAAGHRMTPTSGGGAGVSNGAAAPPGGPGSDFGSPSSVPPLSALSSQAPSIGTASQSQSQAASVSGGGGGAGVSGGANDRQASFIMGSSLSGDYLLVTVQVTSDGVAVVHGEPTLPVPGLDVYVGGVQSQQFLGLAQSSNRQLASTDEDSRRRMSLSDWRDALRGRMTTLRSLLEIVPVSIGIDLDILYPSSTDMRDNPVLPKMEVNQFVDAILHTVYDAGAAHREQSRKILFSSRSPTVCTALNWKQPNYAVFFASDCGISLVESSKGILAPSTRKEVDPRRQSVSEAVRFARSNNLMGIMADALLLSRAPQLVNSVKAAGLLLITTGASVFDIPGAIEISPEQNVDGSVYDGLVELPGESYP
ncbi:phosphate system positive regulatory protein pho81 [Tilletia horrida]|uniref:Phosphate system positive regulatory protein pho81 n=1 Tax=Tilletia horrida TaxID=155126 RepID=A0AAN6GEM9_9BASI|nr:phosphate system positive regulatory protein pho81 [Tilletia horrida]KAK0535123.1 phosphate system positive regulatory protein pho81 [Tilletia horrida]